MCKLPIRLLSLRVAGGFGFDETIYGFLPLGTSDGTLTLSSFLSLSLLHCLSVGGSLLLSLLSLSRLHCLSDGGSLLPSLLSLSLLHCMSVVVSRLFACDSVHQVLCDSRPSSVRKNTTYPSFKSRFIRISCLFYEISFSDSSDIFWGGPRGCPPFSRCVGRHPGIRFRFL